MTKNTTPLVSISCLTFNHGPFLRQCLDGFLMQKTSFPFEIIIHDDCSTDDTAMIIEEYTQRYPNIIFPIYQPENQYSKGFRGMTVKYNFPRCRGKYIALCEGDDYWTDPSKLQKQIDFLEVNPDFAGCSHLISVDNYKKEEYNYNTDDYKNSRVSDTPKDVLGIGEMASPYLPFHTSSYVFRQVVVPDLEFFNKRWDKANSGDSVLFVLSCKYGKIKLLNEKMSVYRIHDGGVTSKDFLGYHFGGILNRYVTWVLLSKEFSKAERKEYFRPVIQHYEQYLIKIAKKMKVFVLLKEIRLFLKAIFRIVKISSSIIRASRFVSAEMEKYQFFLIVIDKIFIVNFY